MSELVDWHTHCFLYEHRTDEDRALWSQRGVLGPGEATPEQHTGIIEEAGVAKFVVVAIPKHSGNHTPADFIADYVARFPGRAVGFCSVHPDDADAPEEFERALGLGLKGIKLSPTYQHMDPRGKACWPLYEIANHHKVPVMFHCGGAYTGSLDFSDPVLLDKVALAFPDLKIIVAHYGQPYMEQTAILMRKNENVFADLSARFHRPWQLYNGLMIAEEYRVTDRLLFGSDFPVRTTAAAMAEFRAINDWGAGLAMPRIREETIEAIMFERPLSLLGIDPAS
jgi:predicted TIM-barrel fold metal-dependent hydrolase